MSSAAEPTCRRTTALDVPEDILYRALEQADRRVLEFALDEVVGAFDLSWAAVWSKGSPESRKLWVGRERGGRAVPWRPHRVPTPAATRVLERGEPWHRPPSGEPGHPWQLGIPVRRGVGSPTGLFADAGNGAGALRLLDPTVQARLSSLAAAALAIDEIRVTHQRTEEMLRVLRDHPALSGARKALLEQTAAWDGRDSPDELARHFPELVGRSNAIRRVLSAALEFARADIPLLIEGESGTGKELVAAAVHRLSPRRDGPFVSENCGAIPESLVEAELFGHEKGAFTGASATRPGILERADGGTIFLDEVGEMDTNLQKRFLRALQERKVRRVGGRRARSVDFRVISATNRNLEELVEKGLFRPDLFYRLHAASISMPALRERREDVPLLVEHFNARFSAEVGREPSLFSSETVEYLVSYDWPGNVRELRNEIWRIVASTRSRVVSPASLSRRILEKLTTPDPAVIVEKTIDEVEREALGAFIRETVRRTGGNLSRAAAILGLTRTSLYRRLEKYGIAVTRKR